MNEAAPVRPMTATEYDEWQAGTLATYAQEMVDSGMLGLEAAQNRAKEQFAEYLPQGAATPGMHLLRVLDGDDAPVGVLWLGPHPRKAGAGYVYDIAVDEERRGEGLGRGAMRAAEAVGRREGWTEIGLNVFGPNTRARTLYESLGYVVVATNMAKPLD
jgi:ribosomal protein S18 acetylase RimI-like enzyme